VLVPAVEERAADCVVEAARALDTPALDTPCEESEEDLEETGRAVDVDGVRVNARSGPNSRLALPADVSAGVGVRRLDAVTAALGAPGTPVAKG
jgi:hypothetical protein